MKKMKLRDNHQGFSLVELIVVVAIMAVLMSITAISYFIVGKANMKSSATQFNQAIGTAQSATMGRTEVYDLYVTTDGNGYASFHVGASGEKHVLSTKEFKFYYFNGSSYVTLGSNATMIISFSRSSGSVKSFTVDGTELIDTMSLLKFRVGEEDGKNYDIELVKATGKHAVK